VAVLSRAVLDVRQGTKQEALAVLRWIERDRDEFEQVVMLAGLEAGHAERFERVVRRVLAGRFPGNASAVGQGCMEDGAEVGA
jgi:hypothetical protein